MIFSTLFRHRGGVLAILLACATLSSPELARPAGSSGPDAPRTIQVRRPAVSQVDSSYENITITEDVTWRGTVLVRGSLVVAPQTTLRIEPGTVVRFMKSPIERQAPRLVVMGRLSCSGTPEKPVFLTSNFQEAVRGDWGGVLFLSSEKRNLIENCRIEGAENAIEARFSQFTAKGVTIARSMKGMMLRDSTASLSNTVISNCETGLESHDSELDLREGTLADNHRGIAAQRSTVVLASVTVKGSPQQGVLAEDCRVKFSSCELADNSVGVQLRGGEGQLLMSRFVRNRELGLHLAGARIRTYRCLFADNVSDGMRVDDGMGVVWASAFVGNGGNNLVNAGRENVTAVQNWWGSNDESAIMAKILDASRDAGLGKVVIGPWLSEKPTALP